MSRIRTLAIAVALIAGVGSAHAQDLTGTWNGSFDGLMLGNPQLGPIWSTGRSVQVTRQTGTEVVAEAELQSISADLTIVIETQSGRTVYGRWTNGEDSFPFICSMQDPTTGTCADGRGYTTVVVTEAGVMDICYVESSPRGRVAGCATLTKG